MSALAFLAKRFVAGEDSQTAIEAVKNLNGKKIFCSLDVLGEDVASEQEARAAKDEYIQLLTSIAHSNIKSNVSVKLTQMGLDISREFCISQMQEILDCATKFGNFVRIDMEGSRYTEQTLSVFFELYEKYKNVGIVIQAYLYRSMEDVKKLAALKAPVRICKGAYKEPASLAYQSMDDIRKNYKELVELLLTAGSKVGIATHDDNLISWARAYVEENKISREQYEFQVLYGLKRKVSQKLASEGHTVRVYVPFGTQWFPYFSRRLRERKENVFFVLKGLISD